MTSPPEVSGTEPGSTVLSGVIVGSSSEKVTVASSVSEASLFSSSEASAVKMLSTLSPKSPGSIVVVTSKVHEAPAPSTVPTWRVPGHGERAEHVVSRARSIVTASSESLVTV